MWERALRLLGLVMVSVLLGYVIGSSGMVPRAVPLWSQAGSPFIVSDLTIQPAEVRPGEPATITVTVANTHHTWGIYSLLLKINGERETGGQANVDAGSSQEVSFNVTRRDPGIYRVFINGLSGSFSVVAP